MSETRGRCRREMDSLHGCNRSTAFHVLADAIDRLAADVASIKAKIDAVSPEDVAHLVECEKAFAELFAEQRDAAIRECKESRALLEVAQVQRTAAYADRDEARAEVWRLKCSMTETSKERDTAIRERDEARAEVERLRAELAARPTAAGWLTEDECWKLRVAVKHLKRLGSGTVNTIEALLARAGSPPVVEVPVMPGLSGAATGEAWRYRAALDKAGVPWKEVPRE